jgi:acyl-CoA thioester hydrolase
MEGKRIEIRWRDLDPLGHVNQAVYHTYVEEIADAWLRRVLGLAEGEVWDYVLARSAIDYRSELRLADGAVVGACSVLDIGTSSVTLRCELYAEGGRLSAEVESVIVTWDTTARRSRPVTPDERAKLEAAAA